MKYLNTVALAVVLSCSGLWADGMPIRGGRFQGGKVTVVLVTARQISSMNRRSILVLTRPQRSLLRTEAGLAPKRFLAYNVMAGENDCTCHAWNRALWFSPTEVEIPHEYLVTDDEAERLDRELESEG